MSTPRPETPGQEATHPPKPPQYLIGNEGPDEGIPAWLRLAQQTPPATAYKLFDHGAAKGGVKDDGDDDDDDDDEFPTLEELVACSPAKRKRAGDSHSDGPRDKMARGLSPVSRILFAVRCLLSLHLIPQQPS